MEGDFIFGVNFNGASKRFFRLCDIILPTFDDT